MLRGRCDTGMTRTCPVSRRHRMSTRCRRRRDPRDASRGRPLADIALSTGAGDDDTTDGAWHRACFGPGRGSAGHFPRAARIRLACVRATAVATNGMRLRSSALEPRPGAPRDAGGRAGTAAVSARASGTGSAASRREIWHCSGSRSGAAPHNRRGVAPAGRASSPSSGGTVTNTQNGTPRAIQSIAALSSTSSSVSQIRPTRRGASPRTNTA